MQSEITINRAQFSIGSRVCHKLLGYRGVVLDVDASFKFPKELAKDVAGSDRPWYHVLVHDTNRLTYVSEQSLNLDASGDEIENPAVDILFTRDSTGHYQHRRNLQ